MTVYRQYQPLRVVRWTDPPSIQDQAVELEQMHRRGLVHRIAAAPLPYAVDPGPEPEDDDLPTGPVAGLRVLIGLILLAAFLAVPSVTLLAIWVFS